MLYAHARLISRRCDALARRGGVIRAHEIAQGCCLTLPTRFFLSTHQAYPPRSHTPSPSKGPHSASYKAPPAPIRPPNSLRPIAPPNRPRLGLPGWPSTPHLLPALAPIRPTLPSTRSANLGNPNRIGENPTSLVFRRRLPRSDLVDYHSVHGFGCSPPVPCVPDHFQPTVNRW